MDILGNTLGLDQPSRARFDALVDKANSALTANQTFLALGSPTTAQTLTQVQRLTREMDALIRLLLGQLQDISDT